MNTAIPLLLCVAPTAIVAAIMGQETIRCVRRRKWLDVIVGAALTAATGAAAAVFAYLVLRDPS